MMTSSRVHWAGPENSPRAARSASLALQAVARTVRHLGVLDELVADKRIEIEGIVLALRPRNQRRDGSRRLPPRGPEEARSVLPNSGAQQAVTANVAFNRAVSERLFC